LQRPEPTSHPAEGVCDANRKLVFNLCHVNAVEGERGRWVKGENAPPDGRLNIRDRTWKDSSCSGEPAPISSREGSTRLCRFAGDFGASPARRAPGPGPREIEIASQDVWKRMRIHCRQLGEIESACPSVIHLPEGLIGYEGHRRYYLLSLEDYLPFRWLVSATDHDLAFAIADPGYFLDDAYPLTLGGSDAELLDLRATDPVEVYTILSQGEGGKGITANLKGPLVVNSRTRLAKQILLYSARLSVRQPLQCDPWVEEGFRMGRTVVRIAGRRVA
jgi:flagellar assembly factor FliW